MAVDIPKQRRISWRVAENAKIRFAAVFYMFCFLFLAAATCPPRLPPPLNPPDLDSLSAKRRQRFDAVKSAIKHAWDGYINVAVNRGAGSAWPWYPADDLNPLPPASGENWLHYAATLHDGLDTLYLAQLTKEYKAGVDLVEKYDLQTTSSALYQPTKTFEYSLRVVGGMLGAASVSGDAMLLQAGKIAADALMEGPFESSWTPLPRIYEVLAPSAPSLWEWITSPYTWISTKCHRLYASAYRIGRDVFTDEHRINSLAGIGSFGLEFSMLSHFTGQKDYLDAHENIWHVVEQFRSASGGLPILWDVQHGRPAYFNQPKRVESLTSRQPYVAKGPVEVGSGADSFYEYLIKIPILKGCSLEDNRHCNSVDQSMLTLYHQFVANELRSSHITAAVRKGVDSSSTLYPTDRQKYHHLLCFVPGMLALGAHHHLSEDASSDLDLSEQLMRGCWDSYRRTPTGLGPETAYIGSTQGTKDSYHPIQQSYLLRPETVESLWVLYRVTKNETYQDWAWSIFESIEKYCRVEHGYAGLKNVYDASDGHVDDMPSFFIAETLKYLLLIFGPDEYVSIDEYVMTTEGHPLPILKNIDVDKEGPCWLDAAKAYNPQIFMPWWIFFAVIGLWIAAALTLYTVWRCWQWKRLNPQHMSRKNQ